MSLDSDSSQRDLPALAAAAFGAATTCFVGLLFLLSSPQHNLVFNWHGSISALFVPVLVNYLLLSLVIFLVLAAIRRSLWLKRTIWPAMFFVLCAATLENILYTYGWTPPLWQKILPLVLALIATVASALWVKPEVFEWLRRAGQYLLQAIAFAGAILLAEALWAAFEARHLNDPPHAVESTVPIPAKAVHHHRVIWIILDELALQQAFTEHPAGEDLPALDALKAQSTLFTNVVPAAGFTEVAVPSLMTGRTLQDADSTADGRLQLKMENGHWIDFDAGDTVFSDAQSLGYHNAIVGWYVPYCRILSGVFSYCFWTGRVTLTIFFPSEQITTNIVSPILHPGSKGAQSHLKDFLQLEAASDKILAAKQYDFVYLHMPVPHPPGIYDQKANAYALNHSSYVDNLALADAYMAHVRQVLEAQGDWDDATLLVMGDHSWRQGYWRTRSNWSPEDEQAARSGFDSRPAYLLKLPKQSLGAEISMEFQAERTRSLLDALMSDQLHTPAEVQNWVANPAPAREH